MRVKIANIYSNDAGRARCSMGELKAHELETEKKHKIVVDGSDHTSIAEVRLKIASIYLHDAGGRGVTDRAKYYNLTKLD